MSITHVTSTAQLDRILSGSKSKLSVIDFHATWCGPCHAIAPTFEALSKQYTNVNFLKVDVDAAQDVAARYRVSAMPTFIFLEGSTKVDQVQGANRRGLEDKLKKYSGGTSTAFSGKGQTLGGSSSTSSNSDSAPAAVDGVVNLTPQTKVLLGLVGLYVALWYFS